MSRTSERRAAEQAFRAARQRRKEAEAAVQVALTNADAAILAERAARVALIAMVRAYATNPRVPVPDITAFSDAVLDQHFGPSASVRSCLWMLRHRVINVPDHPTQ